MKQELLITNDGSHTIFVPELNEHYHSLSGAIQESMHVYIDAGFNYVQKDYVRILEIGFGTGLNTLLTVNEAKLCGKKVYYEAIEAYPLSKDVWQKLNYKSVLTVDNCHYFSDLHNAEWGRDIIINDFFTLKKISIFLNEYTTDKKFDLIYFDAFAPDIQPEMWTTEVFNAMNYVLDTNGVLLTYSAKGIVKQNLRDAGFIITRLKGAGTKHHMLRAVKT